MTPKGAISASEPTAETQTWTCPACTFDNEVHHLACTACGATRPHDGQENLVDQCARIMRRPQNMIGVRFLDPCLLIDHVEVSCSAQTSQETWERLVCWLQEMGKLPFPGGNIRRLATAEEIEGMQRRGAKAKVEALPAHRCRAPPIEVTRALQ